MPAHPLSAAAVRDDNDRYQISAAVPFWIAANLDWIATDAGTTRSEVIRQAVRHFMVEYLGALGRIPTDSAGEVRLDITGPDPFIPADRFLAQVESLLGGRRGLIAVPDDPD